jgi:hypothetical protein
MATSVTSIRSLTLLLGAVWGVLLAPGSADVPSAKATAAWQVDFPSQLGHAYRLEGLTAEGWQSCSEVTFGNGSDIAWADVLTSVQGCTSFRVAEVNPASVGLAPAVLTRKQTLSLAEDPERSAQVALFTSTKGVVRMQDGQPLSMTWSYVKLGADRGQLTAILQTGVIMKVTVDFASQKGGKFSRKYLSAAGVELDSAAGIFALSEELVWATQGEGTMPTNLVGKTITVQTAGLPVTYSFGATQVTRGIGSGPALEVPYTYEPESPAVGVVQLMAGELISEQLQLTGLTPTTGGVVRTKFDQGAPTGQETGSFTRPAPTDNSTNAQCDAPAALEDEVFDLSDSVSGPVTMAFGPDGEGTRSIETGGTIQQSPFTFSYTRIDKRRGRIVTVVPVIGGDEIDEILLTFTGETDCAGTFVRNHYRNGVLLATSNGDFGPGNPPG